MSSRAKVQSQPRSRPRWGNGRARAQWNFQITRVPLPATTRTACSPLGSESCQATLQQLAVHVVRNTTGSPLGWISQCKGFKSGVSKNLWWCPNQQ